MWGPFRPFDVETGNPKMTKETELPDNVFNEYLMTAMEQSKDKLQMTDAETNRFAEAMKKPDFTKLMKEYMDEISDPKNREEQEAYLKQMEQENKIPGNMLLIHPRAGFCIKTYRLEEKITGTFEASGKMFINVCSALEIEEPSSKQSGNGSSWNLPYSLGPLRYEKDKAGVAQTTFDFAMNPKTLELSNGSPHFLKMVINTALDAVESRCTQVLTHTIKIDKLKARVLNGVPCIGGKPAIMHIQKNERNAQDKVKTAVKKVDKSLKETEREVVKSLNEPEYKVLHRGHVDLQDFVNTNKSSTRRPKELVVRIKVPDIKSAKFITVETSEFSLKLRTIESSPVKYSLDLPLPYPVNESLGSATFDKEHRVLEITLPVKPAEEKVMANVPTLVEEFDETFMVDQGTQDASQVEKEETADTAKDEGLNLQQETQGEIEVDNDETVDSSEDKELKEILKQALEASKLPLPQAENAAVIEKPGLDPGSQDPTNNDFAEEMSQKEFESCATFKGMRPGFVFRTDTLGTGYYADDTICPQNEKPETESDQEEECERMPESIPAKTGRLLELQNHEIYALD